MYVHHLYFCLSPTVISSWSRLKVVMHVTQQCQSNSVTLHLQWNINMCGVEAQWEKKEKSVIQFSFLHKMIGYWVSLRPNICVTARFQQIHHRRLLTGNCEGAFAEGLECVLFKPLSVKRFVITEMQSGASASSVLPTMCWHKWQFHQHEGECWHFLLLL